MRQLVRGCAGFVAVFLLLALSPLGAVSWAASAAQPAPAKPRLLVLELGANGVAPATAKTVYELLVVELDRRGRYSVLGGNDVKQMLELENQKQLMGCAQESCLAEVAGALGAERVVYGSLGRLGDKLVLSLSLFDPQQVRSLRRVSKTLDGVGEIPARMGGVVDELLGIEAPPSPGAGEARRRATQAPAAVSICSGSGLRVRPVAGLRALAAQKGELCRFAVDGVGIEPLRIALTPGFLTDARLQQATPQAILRSLVERMRQGVVQRQKGQGERVGTRDREGRVGGQPALGFDLRSAADGKSREAFFLLAFNKRDLIMIAGEADGAQSQKFNTLFDELARAIEFD